MMPRSAALSAMLAVATTLGGAALRLHAADAPPRVVPVVAQRFHYTPAEITLKRGEPVVLEFTSLDFVHGFKVPDLGIRADLPPGTVIRVALTPAKAGVYDFLCDNFCGAGHEEMSGRIVVTE